LSLVNLTSLNLGQNLISTEGAAALAASAHLSNLTWLYLRNNSLGDVGVAQLKQRYTGVVLV
jgi:hypothetical protein